jgi:hypothetical protein
LNARRAGLSRWLALVCLLCLPSKALTEDSTTELQHQQSSLQLTISPDYDAATKADLERWIKPLSDSILQV